MNQRKRKRWRRNGTTIVETAFVLPVFITFIFGLIEVGHTQMVSAMMRSSTRNAARYGSTSGVSSDAVAARCKAMLAGVVNPDDLTVDVKDVGLYDEGGTAPEDDEDFENLDDIELSDAEPRQLFLIRASISYRDVSLMNLPMFGDFYLTSNSITRHE